MVKRESNIPQLAPAGETVSRRRLLAVTGRLPLAAGLWAVAPVHTWAASPAKPSCTLGFSTYGMQGWTTERAFELLEQIGYSAVELTVRSGWDADSATLGVDRLATLRRQLAASPLKLSSLMEHLTPTSSTEQKEALERLKLAAQVAHALAPDDPPVIQTVLGGRNFDNDRARLLDQLKAWLAVAQEHAITLAIKPHRGGAVSQPAEAIDLLQELGMPARMKMVYDYSHYAFRDLSISETVRLALPHTVHIAVKDAVQRDGRVVFDLPGQANTIDYVQLLRQFHAGGYAGDVNAEVSSMVSGQPNYDAEAAARHCYQFLADVFVQAALI